MSREGNERNSDVSTHRVSGDANRANIGVLGEEVRKSSKERRIKSKKKKNKGIYEKVLNVVDRILDLYHLENKRRNVIFKRRKLDDVATIYHLKKIKQQKNLKEQLPEDIDQKKINRFHRSLLEKETITKMKEMLKPPVMIQDIEQELNPKVDFKAAASARYGDDDFHIIEKYLDKFREERKSVDYRCSSIFEEITNKKWYELILEDETGEGWIKEEFDEDTMKSVISKFKLESDNLFTNEELNLIKYRGKFIDVGKKQAISKIEAKSPIEVMEWNEFLEYFAKILDVEDKSTMSATSSEDPDPTIEHTDIEYKQHTDIKYKQERIRKALKRWLDRESPLPSDKTERPGFQFYERRYPPVYTLLTGKQRLEAAVRYLELAQLAYPGIDVNCILRDLFLYFENERIPVIPKKEPALEQIKVKQPSEKLRFFDTITDSKESANIFKRKKKVNKNKLFLRDFRTLINKYDLKALNKEFEDAALPTPYNRLYRNTVKGILQIYDHIVIEGGSMYKKRVFNFIKEILYLLLHTIKWIIDTLFRNYCPAELLDPGFRTVEISDGVETIDKLLSQREEEGSKVLSQADIKKEMIRVIKYQKLHQVVYNMIYKNADMPSSENTSSLSDV